MAYTGKNVSTTLYDTYSQDDVDNGFVAKDGSGNVTIDGTVTADGLTVDGTTVLHNTASDEQLRFGYSDTYEWGLGRKAADGSLVLTGYNGASSNALLNIDLAGRVTMPYQPYANLTMNGGWRTLINGTAYGIGSISAQKGNNFYTGSLLNGFAVIHASKAGTYEVTLKTYNQGTSSGRLNVYKNNANAVTFVHFSTATLDNTSSSTGIVYMNSGDYLNYVINQGDITNYHAGLHTEVIVKLIG